MKCGVRGVKSAVRSVKKMSTWRCVAPGTPADHVLGQQHGNNFEKKRARAGLAGARRTQVL